MTIRDILVHIDGEPATAASERRRAYAISLAELHRAHLTGLVFALNPILPAYLAAEFPVAVYEEERQASFEASRKAADDFRHVARTAGIEFDAHTVATASADAAGHLAEMGRIADLVVVGQPEPDDPLAVRDLLLEGALFDSGRPTLVVPHGGPSEAKLGQITVAWDGGRVASRAVHDALPMIENAASVEVLVIGDSVLAPQGMEPGGDVALHLARHGLDVTVTHRPRSQDGVAATILSQAAATGSDLIVMGGYGRSRLREFILGGTTRAMLERTTVPVLMSH